MDSCVLVSEGFGKQTTLTETVVGIQCVSALARGQKIEKRGLEKLVYHIFVANGYNELVRPTDNQTGLTHVSTELKLLGIDLVS